MVADGEGGRSWTKLNRDQPWRGHRDCGQPTSGSASAAISSPHIACALRLGWKPSRENKSGTNGSENRSTTRRGSRLVKPSAAACSATERQPRMFRSGHGRAGKRSRGATPATTTAASPIRLRIAVTSSASSSAKTLGELSAVASLTPNATMRRSAGSHAIRGSSCARASLTVAPGIPSPRQATGRPVRRASARAVVAATASSPCVEPDAAYCRFTNGEQPYRSARARH